jgi:TPR repeat protein
LETLMIASCGKLAQSGDATAQGILGDFYSVEGAVIPADSRAAAYADSKALYWFRKAAAQGFAKAQFGLGVMFYTGQGVPRDYTKALYWFRKAAAQGFADAQLSLGVMYTHGQGVPQDYVRGGKWLILAKAGGVEQVNKLLSSLKQRMTPAQIAEAQRLANQWWETHHKQ